MTLGPHPILLPEGEGRKDRPHRVAFTCLSLAKLRFDRFAHGRDGARDVVVEIEWVILSFQFRSAAQWTRQLGGRNLNGCKILGAAQDRAAAAGNPSGRPAAVRNRVERGAGKTRLGVPGAAAWIA